MGKKRIKKETTEDVLKRKDIIEKLSKKKEERAVRTKRKTKEANIYINSSYNNIIITLTDLKGNVLTWSSSGNIGFKGPKKATSYAASKVVNVLIEKAKRLGIEEIKVFVKGVGGGRDSAIRSLGSCGLDIVSITDVTPIPHNGCRPPKVRRV